jgi:hypothetical protein
MTVPKLPTRTGVELKWTTAKEGDSRQPARYTVTLSNLDTVEAHIVLTMLGRLQLYRAVRVDAGGMEGLGENLAEHPEVLRVIGDYLNRESGTMIVDPAKRA